MNKIKSKSGNLTTNRTDIKRIRRKSYEFYANKIDNLYKLKKFLDTEMTETDSRIQKIQ